MDSKMKRALAMAGALAMAQPAMSGNAMLGSMRPGEHWPHPTKKRRCRADRVRAYKSQRAANRERRRLLQARQS